MNARFFAHLRSLRVSVALVTIALATSTAFAGPPPLDPTRVDDFDGKPRAVILTDIGNEPDDQMSLVRLLLYANEIELEGLIATTSTWQKTKVMPETVREVIAAYSEVQPNLLKHTGGWPTGDGLRSLITIGPVGYGMAATNYTKPSQGALALVAAADRPDSRPLWVSVWGGANTLAEALAHVRATRRAEAIQAFVAKLRVYSISDQDDAGPWIRREFPSLFYIVKPSAPGGHEYVYATWTGISGDVYYRNCDGADLTTVTNEWLDVNVRAKGPLGKRYPQFAFIMEGDTPAFLHLTNNGLNSYRNPTWGGWGGRYLALQPYGETRTIWSQGGDLNRRVTSQDTVVGHDGKPRVSDQATIWRWRTAFQNEFAARMDWTIKSFQEANHSPIAVLNEDTGKNPLYMTARQGDVIKLNANGSRDPDGDTLQYRWYQYTEAGFSSAMRTASVTLLNDRGAAVEIRADAACRATWSPNKQPCATGIAHIILEVTDGGSPALTTYRRVILKVEDSK